MKKYVMRFATAFLMVMSIIGTSWKAIDRQQTQHDVIKNIAADSLYSQLVSSIYHEIHLDAVGLTQQVFEKALTGFYNMKYSGLVNAKSILTIADFDQESTRKRLYIIDLADRKLILNTWVAHGQNSGGDKPSSFSNKINSNQSSLGFYLTGEIYYGKHGRSLKLDGMDQNFNNNARERSIVVHGASYVSQKSIDELGRLGRSQGCPAVPAKLADDIINTISDHTVLYIHNSNQLYYSSFLNETLAASVALNQPQVFASKTD